MTEEPKPLALPPLRGSAPKPKQQEQKVEYQEQPEAEPPRDPVEDPDTLHSASYARVVEAISEGEIEGLVDRNGNLIEDPEKYGQAIFLDDTPLQSTDGKFNFRGVQVGMTFGTADQSVIVGFGKAADTIYIGAELKKGFPVSQGITNPDAEMVEVAVRFQSMLQQDKSTGDIHGSQVTYEVRCQLNGGSFVTLQTVTVRGKTRSPYLKTTSHRLPRSATPESDSWVIRVVRLTDEPASLDVANATAVDFITVQTRNRFRYPYTALVATEIAARGFSGIPTRAYRVKGLRIRVPNNYFPESREYNRDPLTGDPVVDGEGNPVEQDWNGGFYVAWTNNPAWIFFDLCTNTRYGLGQQMGVTPTRPDGNVDKWSLYPVARYCDEPVKDGFGGMEPRFQCSIYLQAREDAFKVLLDFCSVFRGTPYWQGGAISVTQDRPRPVFRDFTNANVLEGVFTYSGTARKARHTVAIVRYSDPDNSFKPAYEYVSDPVGLAKYGVREIQVAGFACCSRGQAHRLGQWILQTGLYATEVVTFKAGMEGAIMRPGDVFRVLDNNRAGVPQGGRLKAIAGDRKAVTLDREITLPAGTVRVSMGRPQAFAIASQLTTSDQIDSLRTPQVYEVITTTGAGAGVAVLTFADPIPAEVEPGAVFVVRTPTVDAQLFSLINVEESGPNEYQLTGLRYLPSKFGAIEEGLQLEEPDITDLPENPADVLPVTNIKLVRNAVVTPEGVSLRIVVSWEAPPSPLVDSYTVEKRLGSDNWEIVEHTKATHSEFRYTVAGTYQVKVTARSTFGGLSDGIIAELVVPNTNPIELYSVTGLELAGQGNDTEFVGLDARFTWRINSPTVATELGQEALDGSTAAGDDPYFRDFVFEVWDINTGLLLYTENTVNTALVFSYSKNSESPNGPHNQFRVEVRGRDRYGNTTQPAVLVVSNPPPGPPEALSVESIWRVAMLSWINPTDTDLAGVEVFAGTSPDFASATLIATTTGTTYQHTGMPLGQKTWYWVRARDTFGNRSVREPLGEGVSIVPGSLPITDVDEFGIDETKIFREVVVLKGAVWTHHQPTVDAISWNGHQLIFRGRVYDIEAGDTALRYVWWRGPLIGGDGETEVIPGETVYRTSDVHPKDAGLMTGQNDFIIATNAENAGVYDLAWRGFANAVIGSAYIAAISASKIVAGTIGAELIRLATGGRIESQDFAPGVSGWGIAGNGAAEFNNVTIRGNLSTTSGYFNPAFPARIFQPRPSMVLPIEQWNSNYNGGATLTKNSNSFQGSSGFTTRRVLPYYGQLTIDPWSTDAAGAADSIPSPAVAPLFFGVDLPDFTFPHPTTSDSLTYFARPRRLAVAGTNIFTLEAVVKCDSGFSVWYQFADAPVWMVSGKMRSIGNTYGPIADPLNVGGTWMLAAEIRDAAATTGYQTLTMNTRVAIDVPANKVILFAIAPMYGDATRPTNDRYKLLNGYLEVTAENIGNILVTVDPGDTVPEEA